MYDQEIPASQIKADRFPFPCEGDITLGVRNKNYALGQAMLHMFERKMILQNLLPGPSQSVLYMKRFASGKNLFRLICERDIKGGVAKQASARYTPVKTTWL